MIVNQEKFNNIINNGIVVVDFFADWCGPCKMMSPIIDELADEVKAKATIVKVNVENEAGLAGQYGVSSIPTIIYFKNGKEVERAIGVQSKQSIENKINSLV
jgi:thioredoxin 1